MSIIDGYSMGNGGYYKTSDMSGPYSIADDGTATLIGAGDGGGTMPTSIEVSNFPATQAVSGPLTNAQLIAVTGTAAQTAVTTDPAAAGQTVAALLRGILSELQSQKVILEQIATNTTTPGG